MDPPPAPLRADTAHQQPAPRQQYPEPGHGFEAPLPAAYPPGAAAAYAGALPPSGGHAPPPPPPPPPPPGYPGAPTAAGPAGAPPAVPLDGAGGGTEPRGVTSTLQGALNQIYRAKRTAHHIAHPGAAIQYHTTGRLKRYAHHATDRCIDSCCCCCCRRCCTIM